ncbi:MAG: hypothetical protein ABIR52_08585 [Casimicrobiaceae bacterium]
MDATGNQCSSESLTASSGATMNPAPSANSRSAASIGTYAAGVERAAHASTGAGRTGKKAKPVSHSATRTPQIVGSAITAGIESR